MAEAQIDARETGIARLDRCNANFALGADHVPGKNLLRQSHRTRFLGLDRRQKDFSLHARYIKWKQSSIFDHLPRDLVFPGGKFAERNFFSGTNPVDQRKIG